MTPQDAFQELIAFLDNHDALELLCQASMTYLFSKAGEFHSESDDIQIWGRHIEFAAGYYATRPDDAAPKGRVSEETLVRFKELMDQYYLAVDLATAFGRPDRASQPFTLISAQIHSMHVRGEAYPHQFETYARELYGSHDEWFLSKLGFTISDAFALAKAFTESLNDRYSKLSISTKEAAKQLVESDPSWREAGLNEKDAEVSTWCQLFFGMAKEHYRFTLLEIVASSGISENRCRAALMRLSQRRPYRNTQFPNTFTDADKAPWDYNTLSERPILNDGEDYWVLIPYLLRQNLYYTFFFDLMADKQYRPTFEAARGKYLEEKSSEYLRRIFPNGSVLLNPLYPNGEEFSDVLVLHDGKIVIVQCKAKTLTRPAFIGADTDAVKSDVQKAIRNAIEQGCKCRRYLESSESAMLIHNGTTIQISMEAVTDIKIIAVTLMPLHTMATRIKEVEDDLQLSHSEFPGWAVSLGDLDIITEICHSPARFLTYTRRRLLLEEGDIRVHGDEMDLLGFYLRQGLWMADEQFKGMNIVAISGFSGEVDEYVFRRWDCGENVDKPRVARPAGFEMLVDTIESLEQFHRTDCAIALLSVSGEASVHFMKMFEVTKQKTIEDTGLHSFSLQGDNEEPGFSLITVDANIPMAFLSDRAAAFGFLKKYAERTPQWVALGWRNGSSKAIDIAFWLDGPWEQNNELDAAVANLKSGTRIPLR